MDTIAIAVLTSDCSSDALSSELPCSKVYHVYCTNVNDSGSIYEQNGTTTQNHRMHF